jgi:hypothetical protein
MTRLRFATFSSLVIAVFMMDLVTTHAVSIRHDRTDADALKLGERFSPAGRVLPDGGCTLVAPTWAVTAAHVASGLAPGNQIEFGQRRYPIKRVVIHPEGAAPMGRPPEVDLALIELAEPVTGIAPALLYDGTGELGRTVVIVGYGDYGLAGKGFQRADGRRRAVTNVVDDAGPRRIFMRFDAPPNGSQFEGVGGPGDSGGPAFIEQNGRLYLAGVSSASMDGKPGTYGVVDVYTRVGTYKAWIERTMQASGVRLSPAGARPPRRFARL